RDGHVTGVQTCSSDLPLRAMISAEAAFLLRNAEATDPDTVVLGADGEDLLLATTKYVLPDTETEQTPGQSPRPFRALSANWGQRSEERRVGKEWREGR